MFREVLALLKLLKLSEYYRLFQNKLLTLSINAKPVLFSFFVIFLLILLLLDHTYSHYQFEIDKCGGANLRSIRFSFVFLKPSFLHMTDTLILGARDVRNTCQAFLRMVSAVLLSNILHLMIRLHK